MSSSISVAALATALVAAGAAWSGNPPLLTGSFKTIISGKTSRLNGTWVLKIDRLGHSTISKNGRIVVTGAVAAWLGHFQITDTSGPAACKGVQASGAYTYTLKGNQLALKVGFDQCSGRLAILHLQPRPGSLTPGPTCTIQASSTRAASALAEGARPCRSVFLAGRLAAQHPPYDHCVIWIRVRRGVHNFLLSVTRTRNQVVT